MAEDEGGTPQLGNDVGDGEGFAAAGDALQHLGTLPAAYAFDKLAYGFGLVAHGGEV